MKQTVEEAAREAIHKHYNCNGTYPCSEREYCEHCNGIIQHSIVANVVQMNLKKDLLPVRTGISTACGTRLKMKCHKLMENTKMNIIRRYHALYMGN